MLLQTCLIGGGWAEAIAQSSASMAAVVTKFGVFVVMAKNASLPQSSVCPPFWTSRSLFSMAKAFDVVVYGATGYTGAPQLHSHTTDAHTHSPYVAWKGRLVAAYIAKQYGVNNGLKWAIGGRSQTALMVRPHCQLIPLTYVQNLDCTAGSSRLVARIRQERKGH